KDIDPTITKSCLAKKGRWALLFVLFRFCRLVYKIDPDIVHPYMGITNILGSLLQPLFLRRKPKVVWGVRTSEMLTKNYDWLRIVEQNLETFLASTADLIICNSFAGRQYFLRQNPKIQRIEVIPN